MSEEQTREQAPASPADPKTPVTAGSEFTHTAIELVGRHVPEPHEEVVSAHERRKVMLPGVYEIGALIEGAFIPLARLKAAEVLEAIERVKQSAESPGSDAA